MVSSNVMIVLACSIITATCQGIVKDPKQFGEVGRPGENTQEGGSDNGNTLPLPFQNGNFGGSFQRPPGGNQQAQEEEQVVDEEDSSPGPGALGVLTGLWGVFNGIGSLLNGGNPNKILESSVNFFPPHQREMAQAEINKALGKTTTKTPQIIYVTYALPNSTANGNGTAGSPVVLAQAPPPTVVVPIPATTLAAAQSPTNVAPTTTTDDGDESEEDEYKVA